MLRPKKWKQIFAGIVASLGAACQGLAAAFPSSALPQMQKEGADFYVTDKEASLMVSMLMFCAAVGSIVCGPLMNWIGRKRLLFICSLPTIAGFVLIALAKTITTMMIGRGTIGFFTGICIPVGVVYISECTEAKIRGRMCLLVQLFFGLGNLLEYVIGALAQEWRLTTWISLALPVIFFCLLIKLPETPRHLLKKGKEEEAEKALTWLREDKYDVKSEIDEIQENLKTDDSEDQSLGAVFESHNILAFIYSLILGILYGSCGGIILTIYAEPLSISLKSPISPKLVSISMGVTQAVGTIISFSLIDRIGRRHLLQLSGGLMSLVWAALALYCYAISPEHEEAETLSALPVVLLIAVILGFALGYNAIPIALASEMLPSEIRAVGTASNYFIGALSIAVTSYCFLSMIKSIELQGTFLVFCFICILSFLFPTYFIPETKGKTLEQLEKEAKERGLFPAKKAKKKVSEI